MRISIINIAIIVLILLLFQNCKNNDSYFNGELKIVDLPSDIDSLNIESHLVFDGLYTDYIDVYDSLILFIAYKFPDYYLNVFNLNTKKQVGSFFKKGNGPNEALFAFSYRQFYKKYNNLFLWMTLNDAELVSFNMTKSINDNSTILDKKNIKLNWIKKFDTPFVFVYVIDSTHYIAKSTAKKLSKISTDYKPGEYILFDSKSNEIIKTFKLFKKPIINKNDKQQYPVEQYLSSYDVIKPDKTKIAMSMVLMSQINILDLKNGTLKAVRLRNTPDLSYLEKEHNKYTIFHRGIAADDDYIYVPYLNTPYDGGMGMAKQINNIHVYNWDGEFIKNIFLTKPFLSLAVDQCKKKLYTIDNEDEVYSYNIELL